MALSHQESIWDGIVAARAIRLGLSGKEHGLSNASEYPMIPNTLRKSITVRVLPIVPSQVNSFGNGGIDDETPSQDELAEGMEDEEEVLPSAARPEDVLPKELDLPLAPFVAPLPHVRWIDPRPAEVVAERAQRLLSEPASGSHAAPSRCSGRSLIVHMHGGGHHIGGSGAEDTRLSHLANSTGLPVAALSYRLSPEVRFPAHFEDAVRGLSWVSRSARALGVDEMCMILMGDSAGGQLAASVAIFLREMNGRLPQTEQEASAGLPPLRARAIAQVLIYPLVDSAVHVLGPLPDVSSARAGMTRSYPSLQDPWVDWRPLLPGPLARSFGLGSLPRGALPGGRRGRVGFSVGGLSGGDGSSDAPVLGSEALSEAWLALQRVWGGAAGPMDRIEKVAYEHGYYGLTPGVRTIKAAELPDEAQEALSDWRLVPMAARSHAGLPPALVVTAGWDPLRDEGLAYCDLLKRAEASRQLGNSADAAATASARTRCIHFDDMFHGYYGVRSSALPSAFRTATEATDNAILELMREVGAGAAI